MHPVLCFDKVSLKVVSEQWQHLFLLFRKGCGIA